MATQTKKTKKTDSRVRRLNTKQRRVVAKEFKKVPSGFKLLKSALSHIWNNRRLFIFILLIYAALYFVLVKGLATNFQLSTAREQIESSLGDDASSLAVGPALMAALITSTGSAVSESAGVYQALLLVIFSLVIIWALRQTMEARTKVRLGDAFYKGSAPLVQYILVMLAVFLQSIPALLGGTLYSIVSNNGIAVNGLEKIIWFLLLLICMGISIYMISASLFATYIVTLPGVRPMKALSSARKLVRFRRFTVIRKVVFFPLIAALVMLGVFWPLVLFVPVAAEVAYIAFTIFMLLLTHAYYYTLYRELL